MGWDGTKRDTFAELAYVLKIFLGTTTKCSSLKGLHTISNAVLERPAIFCSVYLWEAVTQGRYLCTIGQTAFVSEKGRSTNLGLVTECVCF